MHCVAILYANQSIFVPQLEYSLSRGCLARLPRRLWNGSHHRHANMPVLCRPLTPHFYIVKLRFTGGIPYFLIFALKYRLWILVRTASKRILVLSKHMKNTFFFHLKIIMLQPLKLAAHYIGIFA